MEEMEKGSNEDSSGRRHGMNAIVSLALASLSGICFASGMALLLSTGKR